MSTTTDKWRAMVAEEHAGVESQTFMDWLTLIYGDKKVGKSTFASGYPGAFIVDIEDGMRNILPELNKRGVDFKRIRNWMQLRKITTTLKDVADEMEYRTTVFDGLGEAVAMCQDFVLETYGEGANDINDGALSFGKGNRLVVKEMRQWFNDAKSIGTGLVFVAHEQTETLELATRVLNRALPEVPPKVWSEIKKPFDLIMRAKKVTTKDGTQHVLYTKGTEDQEGADPTMKLPDVLPLSFEAFEKAYNTTTKEKKA